MSVSEFQKALHQRYTTIKACKHDSDYAVLHDYVDRELLLCHSCWNDEKSGTHRRRHRAHIQA